MPMPKPNPQNPTDLLGRSIAVDDIVAWSHLSGRSACVTVARIEKIKFFQKVDGRNHEVPQSLAEGYTLSLRPIKSTSYLDYVDKQGKIPWPRAVDRAADPDRFEAKLKVVQSGSVMNLVKVDGVDA